MENLSFRPVKQNDFMAMEELGWTGKVESVPTFKSKIWAPSRPVVHAAAAYVLGCTFANHIFPIGRQVDGYFFMFCLEHPSTIAALIRRSEAHRLMLADVEQFKIKEEETIQILAEGVPLEFGDSRSAESQPVGPDMPRETIRLGLSMPFTS